MSTNRNNHSGPCSDGMTYKASIESTALATRMFLEESDTFREIQHELLNTAPKNWNRILDFLRTINLRIAADPLAKPAEFASYLNQCDLSLRD